VESGEVRGRFRGPFSTPVLDAPQPGNCYAVISGGVSLLTLSSVPVQRKKGRSLFRFRANFTREICHALRGVAMAPRQQFGSLSRTEPGASRKNLKLFAILIDGFFRVFSGSGFPKMSQNVDQNCRQKMVPFQDSKEKSDGPGRQSGRSPQESWSGR
jgi:hypothetical protein